MTVDTEELKRLAEAATPGPWRPILTGDDAWGWVGHGVSGWLEQECDGEFKAADVRFIAAANPSAVLALLDRVRRLEEALREVHTTPREAMSLDAQMDLDRRVQRLLGLGGA